MSEKTPRLKCSSKATVYALNDHSLISCQKQGMFYPSTQTHQLCGPGNWYQGLIPKEKCSRNFRLTTHLHLLWTIRILTGLSPQSITCSQGAKAL